MASPLYLGIDTATRFLVLSLWSEGEGLLGSYARSVDRDHARQLLPELQELFAAAGREPQQLTGIGVGVGPGSYTGLRIGLATARGLARGLNSALGGCSTLAAIAFGTLADGEAGVAVLDARRGNVYAGAYRRVGQGTETLAEPHKIARPELARLFPDMKIVEEGQPDGGFIARSARTPTRPDAIYL